jgi:hypothetical protein
MPSDEHFARALEAVAPPVERFQSALATAVEEVRTYLSTHGSKRPTEANGQTRLGHFAQGRIDPARFAALLEAQEPVDVRTLGRMERAFEALSAAAAGEETWRADVERGGDLRAAVARALDRIGRVFGAARVAERSRTGRYVEERDAALLDGIPFSAWSGGERLLAPALVVRVDGADLRAAALAEFLDGALKIVLLVRGEAPPAPLVRLVSPGLFVLQTNDVAELPALGKFDGPGVAALLPDDAARFVHDPAAGPELHDRLTVQHLPDSEPTKALGGQSPFQQSEDLRQLAALAVRPAAPAAPAAAAAASAPAPAARPAGNDPVDALATWLLAQADLGGGAG